MIAVPTAGEPLGAAVWTPGDPDVSSTMVAGTLTELTGDVGFDSALKPFYEVVCGENGEAELVALTLGLCFSNLHQRAYPEWIRANTDFALVQQARMAEEWVLSIMKAASSDIPAGTTVLGTSRDTLKAIRIAAQEFRWNNRLAQTTPLTFIAPNWVRDAMAADLTFQAPGDDAFNTSTSEVDGWFSDFNVDPVWTLDGLSGAGFTAKNAYPATFDFILYATGAFLRLDGGSLDLGVVRTKEDIQTNRYCTFTETFEAVAYIGPEVSAGNGAWSYTGSLAVKTKGGVGGAVTIA